MKSVKEIEIINAIKKALRQIKVDNEILNNTLDKNFINKKVVDIKKQIKFIEEKIKSNNNVLLNLYKDKIQGTFNENTFNTLLEESEQEKDRNLKELKNLNEKLEELKSKKIDNTEIAKIINEFLKFEKLDRNMLCVLIEKILVYRNQKGENKLKIYFNFSNENHFQKNA